jgi:hypothetical protein
MEHLERRMHFQQRKSHWKRFEKLHVMIVRSFLRSSLRLCHSSLYR